MRMLKKIFSGLRSLQQNRDLTQGPIHSQLASLTIPMILGIIAIMVFNLVDTYFISLMAQEEALAAISFTFPVTMLVFNIAIGMGIGVSVGLARKIGEGNEKAAVCFSVDGLLLSLLVGFVIMALGMLSIEFVFSWLNVDSAITMGLIHDYMLIWYLGVPTLMLPVVGNNLMRARGDAVTPGLLMIASGVLNGILDPILIFGWGPIPAYGIQGAAIATVLAWTISMGIVLALLRRKGLLEWAQHNFSVVWNNWKQAMYVAGPASLTNILVPLAAFFLTAMLGSISDDAVAGFGVGARIESLALLVVFAMTAALSPFVAQNFGAKQYGRIHTAVFSSIKFAIIFELVMYVILAVSAPFIAPMFSDDELVQDVICWSLWILPLGYGGQSVVLLLNAAFNALSKPLLAAILNIFRLFALYVPLAYVGGEFAGVPGILAGAALGNLLAGIVAWVLLKRSTVFAFPEPVKS